MRQGQLALTILHAPHLPHAAIQPAEVRGD
jgi:hypothetical protein